MTMIARDDIARDDIPRVDIPRVDIPRDDIARGWRVGAGSLRSRLWPFVALLVMIGTVSGTWFGMWWHGGSLQAWAGTCTTGSAISKTFTTGATWELCWHEQAAEGIVLSDLYYTPPAGERRKILQEATLSQIEVLYDDGLATNYYASEPGLGGNQLLTLSAADCPSGTLLSIGERAVLCQQSGARGYLYKYYATQKQGEDLTLFSASQIGQRLYIIRWRFLDDGTIAPQVGDGGRLLRRGIDDTAGWPIAEDGTIGIGYLTNFWWRLDFDLAGNGTNDIVDEISVESVVNDFGADSGQRATSATQINSEGARTTDPDTKRSWRLRDGASSNGDGHAISYHLEPKEAGFFYSGAATEPWNAGDLYITVDKSCERLAAHNPTDPSCATSVAGFANGESIAGADIVLWYRMTAHRLPRAEDLPLLEMQWHGYQLLPRDWTAQNPF